VVPNGPKHRVALSNGGERYGCHGESRDDRTEVECHEEGNAEGEPRRHGNSEVPLGWTLGSRARWWEITLSNVAPVDTLAEGVILGELASLNAGDRPPWWLVGVFNAVHCISISISISGDIARSAGRIEHRRLVCSIGALAPPADGARSIVGAGACTSS